MKEITKFFRFSGFGTSRLRPLLIAARQHRSQQSTNQQIERTLSAQGQLRETHFTTRLSATPKPARATTVSSRSNTVTVARAASLLVSSSSHTHTFIVQR